MASRREFLNQSIGGAALLLSPSYIRGALDAGEYKKLTILHTNDTHSRIDPFPSNDPKYPGQAGIFKRDKLIRDIRSNEKNVLLFDSGDIFQGTPYFNLYGGEIELKAMSYMKYDASTMGNHDFDNGLDAFKKVLPYADFPFICSNYDFSNTILHASTKKYKIFKINGLRIGVFGLGVELNGLVMKKNYGETQYINPIETAKKYASLLRNDHECDLVVCLSHLGYEYKENKVSDLVLAKECRDIDLVLGGHTHTFLNEPTLINNDGKKLLINQCGFGGIMLGRIDVLFHSKVKSDQTSSRYQFFDKKNTLI